MIKRKKYINLKKLKLYNFINNEFSKKLQNSFKQNHFQKPLTRLSFFINSDYVQNEKYFYKTQNKLQCYLSYSFRVPSKRLHFSRFYLVRSVDKLLISNYQK